MNDKDITEPLTWWYSWVWNRWSMLTRGDGEQLKVNKQGSCNKTPITTRIPTNPYCEVSLKHLHIIHATCFFYSCKVKTLS